MSFKLSDGTAERQSGATISPGLRRGTRLIAVLALGLAACGPSVSSRAEPAGGAAAEAERPVRLGVDVLLDDSLHVVAGRRVGLITNHTGVSWTPATRDPAATRTAPTDGVSTIDRLAAAEGVELVALFSPEHGIRGRAEGGEPIGDEVDPETGLPIYSLYGETRRPTPRMLDGLDLLLFDIQDIGARYYTYVWTMALAMEAAGEAGVAFVVLDRPNPIGGHIVQGNVLDPDYATFVGLYPVPMRHGLTAGELARLLVGHFGIRVHLHVIPMDGWGRSDWHDDTRLPFVPPSPNMPSLASATHYPGTCLFEGTNVSVGRGTDLAFQQIGAPWLDARVVADSLNAIGLEGVRFEAITFVPEAPGDRKYDGETVHGVRFITTDRERYDPAVTAIAALATIYRQHADELDWHIAHFDRLAGNDRVRQAIIDGDPAASIVEPWADQAAAFEIVRQPFLIYR